MSLRQVATEASTRTLYLAWQDPDSRRWYTVGKLDHGKGMYVFNYTRGALEAKKRGFTPIVSFPELRETYRSDRIFPLFANQVMSRSRPEYADYIQWLSIAEDKADPIAILARSGEHMTDTLEIFPHPERQSDEAYSAHFFVHGLRHQSTCAVERSMRLEPQEDLLLMSDIQNPYDDNALAVRTAEKEEQDMHILGYLPRYLAGELATLDDSDVSKSRVTVVRVNPPPAPIHFRILCRLTMQWSRHTPPFSGADYEPLSSGPTAP